MQKVTPNRYLQGDWMSFHRTATLVATAALAATIASAPAQAKPSSKPDAKLRVTKVAAAPTTVRAGEKLSVDGTVRNSGKREGRGDVQVFLRDRGDRTAIGSTSVRVGAKQSRAFSLRATVPRSLDPGTYRLLACVKDRGGKGRSRCRDGGTIEVTGRRNYTPGARSLGDPLFPQTGNGGYDARRYEIDIDYDPVTNVFGSATTTMRATATQDLSEFSLDFQDMDVASVSVNGEPASFEQVAAEPPLGDPAEVTQLMKLVVTPGDPIDSGQPLVVRVAYSGAPVRLTDIDGSYEGWIPACYGPGQTPPCDGGFVVNQPNGAQAWFPNNNYPTDKARFETSVTVPTTHTAFGVGELSSRTSNGDGTWTWNWDENTPTSTYLTTATVGLFDYEVTSMIESTTNRALTIYNGIDASYAPPASTNLEASLAETDEQLNYLSGLYGAYPLDSYGSVVDRTTDVGYALEVQTKSHYAQIGTASQDINAGTQLHETAHEWMGNTVTLERWPDIWFNEGWATWSEWIWGFETQGGDSPAAIFDDLYANTPDEDWAIAPAVLDGDPVNLFAGFPVYDRGAMVVQGTREIIGDTRFETLKDRLLSEFRYGNISTREFIALAEQVSGFGGGRLALLDDFYEQWLYGEVKPTILPEDFAGTAATSSSAPSGPVEVPRGGRLGR